MYFYVNDDVSAATAFWIEEVSRLIRVLCQQAAFMWILHNFSKYNAQVDREMARQQRKSFEASKL